jgi:hypothetical protein
MLTPRNLCLICCAWVVKSGFANILDRLKPFLAPRRFSGPPSFGQLGKSGFEPELGGWNLEAQFWFKNDRSKVAISRTFVEIDCFSLSYTSVSNEGCDSALETVTGKLAEK